MDRVYELRAAKRGRRSGMTDGQGRAMTEIHIRHADQGIHWEQAVVAEDSQEDEIQGSTSPRFWRRWRSDAPTAPLRSRDLWQSTTR